MLRLGLSISDVVIMYELIRNECTWYFNFCFYTLGWSAASSGHSRYREEDISRVGREVTSHSL